MYSKCKLCDRDVRLCEEEGCCLKQQTITIMFVHTVLTFLTEDDAEYESWKEDLTHAINTGKEVCIKGSHINPKWIVFWR